MALLYFFSLIFITLDLLWQKQKSKWAKQVSWGKGNQLTWTWTTNGHRSLNNVHPLTVAGLDWICPREVSEGLSLSCLKPDHLGHQRTCQSRGVLFNIWVQADILYIMLPSQRHVTSNWRFSSRRWGDGERAGPGPQDLFSGLFFNQFEVATYPGQVKKWRIKS